MLSGNLGGRPNQGSHCGGPLKTRLHGQVIDGALSLPSHRVGLAQLQNQVTATNLFLPMPCHQADDITRIQLKVASTHPGSQSIRADTAARGKAVFADLHGYFQDLADAGKGASEGLVFVNSFNTEMATGGVENGEPPFEAGASKNDVDFMHTIDWRKAAAVAQHGPTRTVNGMRVIGLDSAVKEKLLFFTPEPKSPHGVDVTPSGENIVVGGKLDPHVTIFSTAKIRAAMAKGSQEKDPFGVPILKLDDTKETQVELGLGPLHTVFDDQGYAYTSMFLDSAVARWTLGGADKGKHPEPDWTLVPSVRPDFQRSD